ncbi:restriction endonuclease subunit S [Chryseobacterium sp. C3]|uniref:restriction endonuclease subunit S n=1 Tax=Chryseobacterium sp. C3 TaxID=2761532 RepID=UPI001627893B|nr:restriction endonuclease subunit S [Chryseobacterium sp. C3]
MRFPEFTEEWETKKLGEILEFKNGINATKEQYGSGYKFINVLDILNNEFITYDKIIGSVNVNEEIIDKFPVNYGDILFQRSSETREEVGTTSVYLDKDKTATFGGFVIRGKKNGEYEPIFLNKSLKTDLIRNQITSKSGGSTRYNIGQEILASVTLPLPSLNEQTKIASFLSLIDSRIQTQNKIIEQLETLIKGISEKVFSQKIRFREFSGDWELKKLGEVFYSEKGKGLSKDRLILNGKYECVLYGELYTKYKEVIFNIVSKTNENDGLKSQIGDLLIPSSTTTTGIDLANVTAINKENVLLGGDITVLRSRKKINNVFYAYYLSNYKKEKIASYAQGSTIVHLYYSHIKDMLIDFPSYEEQDTISQFLSSVDTKIQIEKNILNKYLYQKQYLLQKLFI